MHNFFLRRNRRRGDDKLETVSLGQVTTSSPVNKGSAATVSPPTSSSNNKSHGPNTDDIGGDKDSLWYKKSNRSRDSTRSKPKNGPYGNDEHPISLGNRREHQHHSDNSSLIICLYKGDWAGVSALLERQSSLAHRIDSVVLNGEETRAYPLHVAACVRTPPSIFDRIIQAYPTVIEQGDQVLGRLPLHWACISNAPVYILQRLVHFYPEGCTAQDLAYRRYPLHYLCIHASQVEQIIVLLGAAAAISPDNHKRVLQQKDKNGNTPLSLAKKSNNPIKMEIVNALMNHRLPSLSNGMKEKYHSPMKSKQPQVYPDGKSTNSLSSQVPMHDANSGEPNGVTRSNAHQQGSQVYSQSNNSPRSVNKLLPEDQQSQHSENLKSSRRVHDEEDSSNRPIAGTNRGVKPPQQVYRDPNYSSRFGQPPILPGNVDLLSSRTSESQQQRSVGIVGEPSLTDRHHVGEGRTRRAVPSTRDSHSSSEEAYYARYKQKIDSYSNSSPSHKRSNGPGENTRLSPRSNREQPQKNEEESQSDDLLINSMESNIAALNCSARELQHDLREKDREITDLDILAEQMTQREQELTRALLNAQSVACHQNEELKKKKERIADLHGQFAQLQSLLMEEESTLDPMEKSIMVLEETIIDKEQKLKVFREKFDGLQAKKQGLEEEKQDLARALDNQKSELKSLKMIQNMAAGDDSAM